MPYTFTTKEDTAIVLPMKARYDLSSYVVTAEFTVHPYNQFKPETAFLTLPVTTAGNEMTLELSADDVNQIKDGYFRLKATGDAEVFYVDFGSFKYEANPIADASITLAELGFDVATQAELNAAVDQLVPVSGLDAQVSALVTGQTNTAGQLRAAYAPPTNALQGFLGRIRTGVRDVSLLILSDSTADKAGSWVDKLIPKLAAAFPTHSISYSKFSNTTKAWGAATVTAGSGPRTIFVWNGGISGQTWQYFTDATYRETLVVTPNPDVVWFSNGHNENSTQAQSLLSSDAMLLRDKAVVHIETVRTLVPQAAVVVSSQNPLLSYNVASENRADIYRRICLERGYGFVDVCQAFHDDGRDLATVLVSADGIHPTDTGFELWASETMRHFVSQPTSQPIPMSPPSFYAAARNLAPNPQFSDFTSPPTLPSWAATNCTLAKDTTHFETGSWSLSATKAASGSSSHIDANLPVAFVAGQTVTFAARMWVPSGVTSNAGQLVLISSVGQIAASTIWQVNDQWFWRTVTARIPANATSASLRIMVDPSTGASANMSIDRVICAVGRFPTDVLS